MTQLLAGAGPYSLTKTWYVDGTATDVGDVTIGIDDGNGDEIVAAATATTNNTDGTYTYSLADQPSPDELIVTWTRTDTGADLVDRMELVGNWLFTESQARAFHAKADATAALKPLNSAAEYPDAVIADERKRIQDDLEYWTGRAWIPRYCRLELSGNGGSVLPLSHAIPRTSDGYVLTRPGRLNDIGIVLTVSVAGTALTVSDIEIDTIHERLINKDGIFAAATIANPYNVVVEYIYGQPTLVDGIDRIAMKLLVDRLVPSAFTDRALEVANDYGTVRLVQPGGPMMNVSRIPEVNDWVNRHNHKILLG